MGERVGSRTEVKAFKAGEATTAAVSPSVKTDLCEEQIRFFRVESPVAEAAGDEFGVQVKHPRQSNRESMGHGDTIPREHRVGFRIQGMVGVCP